MDSIITKAILDEEQRQKQYLQLIASENFTSKEVMLATGSVLTNKYAEGYPEKRYYNGCKIADTIESIAIERAKELFKCEYVNVQPHSGTNANLAVYYAFLKPGDTYLGMNLAAGGHLTHGSQHSITGKWFNSVQYGVDENDLIVYDEIERLAHEHKPKMIVSGGSCYPRLIDWSKIRKIADSVGAIFWADIAHTAGLIAGGACQSPIDYADVVTCTTHKTLRGPRGGMIIAKTMEHATKLNSAVFPGTQGGPLLHVIAGKAVAFLEDLRPSFKEYAKQTILNAQQLAKTLRSHDIDLISGGTDTHLLLVDLRKLGINGLECSNILESVGIVCNKNMVPNDPLSPSLTSGLRLGSPACTTLGLKEKDFEKIGEWIALVLRTVRDKPSNMEQIYAQIRQETLGMCKEIFDGR